MLSRWRPLLAVLAVLAFSVGAGAGCSAGDSNDEEGGPELGNRKLGETCAKTEDCESGLCATVAPGRGVCTRTCLFPAGCPSSWNCVKPENFSSKVCACAVTSDIEICDDGIDNDCDALVDECRVCSGEVVPDDDPRHCGACGNACRLDQGCAGGICSCPAGKNDCAGACVDPKTNNDHCGACGNGCGAERECRDGSCACTSFFTPDECGDQCVSLASDSANCGTCGNACAPGQNCSQGQCQCPPSAADLCAGVGCVDLSKDSRNCGVCGTSCTAPQTCHSGSCSCASGETQCGSECVNTKTSGAHCGACGRACGSAQACVNGQCGCSFFGYSVCGDTCANLSVDVAHCGACGKACKSGEICQNGNCLCESGVYCGDTCMPRNDVQNCGACGRTCGQSQYCSDGQCVCSGATACGTQCVNTYYDPENCGSCGTKCGTNEQCSAGQCGCVSGFAECSGVCVNPYTDTRNCGECGKVCRTSEVCTSGACTCPAYNQAFCAAAGRCIDVLADESNCGACGTVCPTGTQCQSGQCLCNDAAQSLCGSTCRNLSTDENNCGSCGHVCSGKPSCTAGQCLCPAPLLGTATRVTTTTRGAIEVRAAWNGTHVGVAYLLKENDGSPSQGNVRFTLLNANGSRALTTDLVLTNDQFPVVSEVSDLIWNGSEFAVIWRAYMGGPPAVVFQRLNADGSSKGAPVPLTRNGAHDNVRVAWSPVNGYAVAGYHNDYIAKSVAFQALGTNASQPGALANYVLPSHSETSAPVEFAASSTGEWAVLVGNPVTLLRINADGSRTQPILTLAERGQLGGIVHDGTNWVSVWTNSYYSTVDYANVYVQRGTAAGSAHLAVPGRANSYRAPPLLALDPRGTVTLSWAQKLVVGDPDYGIVAQRFVYPATAASPLEALLSPELAVLDTDNAVATIGNDWGDLVSTGAARAMQVWIDSRFGNSEVFARSIDFRDCP